MRASLMLGVFLVLSAPFLADAKTKKPTKAPKTKTPAPTDAPTTQPPATTAPVKCSAAWEQCGGNDYKGPTCCVGGYECAPPYANSYYLQCMPSKTTKPPDSGSGSSNTPTKAPAITIGYDQSPKVESHASVYPTVSGNPCPGKLVDNVCCPYYCTTNNQSEKCTGCSGDCATTPSDVCKSGEMWGEKTSVTDKEDWHYSRSTHYGTTNAGACAFGLYAMCTKGPKDASWVDPMLGTLCDAFCKAYPVLCQDPKNITLRGNFAAPNGDYYTQFWPHLVGDRDNYLSCGECFEVIHTKNDGTDYKPGEKGYTDPIILEVTDSCPCHVNSKWCCGSGLDHCGEVSNFKYGCPIPKGSHHLDLSDIAMGRLQGDGVMTEGVTPTRYKRVPCPKPGNVYIWLQDSAGPYYFAIGVVNTAGHGGVSKLEVKGAGMTDWLPLVHNPDYPSAHPQERYGSWVIPKDKGPINPPIGMRITSPNGEQLTNEMVIKSYKPPATAPKDAYYIDFGAQFSMYGKH